MELTAEQMATALEEMAAEVRRRPPSRVALDESRHKVDVTQPEDRFRRYEQGGRQRWMIDLRWDYA